MLLLDRTRQLARMGRAPRLRVSGCLFLIWSLIAACGVSAPLDNDGRATRQLVTPITLGDDAPDLAVAMVWQGDGAPHRLRLPTGLALDQQGRPIVIDAGNDRIQIITGPERPQPWSDYGPAPGQFRLREGTDLAEPERVSVVLGGGLAVDARGDIYVADPFNARIQKFDPSGRLLVVWDNQHLGVSHFHRPVGVAVDAEGAVYVADQVSHHILKLDRDGRFMLRWGGLGSEEGALAGPMALAVDQHRHVYVADSDNARIQKYDHAGRFLRAWGGRGTGPGEFGGPIFLAVDARDYVYAADTFNHRVQVFSGDGLFLAAWGSLGVEAGQFAYSGGIAIDGQGDIYVVDIVNGRVRRFRPRTPWPAASLVTPTPRPASPSPAPAPAPRMTPTDR